jgi:phospholipid/cholesterol/gamma-HCH transport system permease protein
MGLSTEMFFMMMLKMMWFRDVFGLVFKGILFGALPAAICCYEGLRPRPGDDEGQPAAQPPHPPLSLAPPSSTPVFRAVFLSMVAILIMNSSWFMLVYHAVPFYGPTLLPQP